MSTASVGLGRRMMLAFAVAVSLLLLMVGVTLGLLDRSGRDLIQKSTAALERLGRQGLETDARQLAVLLGETLVNPLYYLDLKSIRDLARSALSRSEVRSIRIFDSHGMLLDDGSDGIATFGQRIEDPLVEKVLADGGDASAWRGETLAWAHGIRLGEAPIGGLLLEMSASVFPAIVAETQAELRDTLDRSRREQQSAVLLRLLIFLVFAPLAFLWVSRRVIAPIRRMADRARAIELGHPLPELGSRPPDELGVLADALESMRIGIERQQRVIRELASTDRLTGMPNRRGFEERARVMLEQARDGGERMALVFIDLDGFKRVNDLYGHEAGDRTLAEVARRIGAVIATMAAYEDSSPVVARMGGDEFVVALASGDAAAAAEALARAILDELRRAIPIGPVCAQLGASVGIAVFPDDAGSLTDLLRCADLAMYEAKMAGKNGLHRYDLRMRRALESRAGVELELGAAFERDELVLDFQPILALRSRRPIGAEARLGWNHRERGLLPAERFWSAIEDGALRRELVRWLLREACRAAQSWPAASDGSFPFVAVNIAESQILDGDLEQDLRAALSASGLPPARLHLEVSERALIADEPRMHARFRTLKDLGVQIWLSDFGTGCSGLSRLRELPLDGLKIDRSFIADLLSNPDDWAITEAIIAMSRAFDLRVIADGIESEGQVQALLERRCLLGQGRWLGAPSSPAAMRERFAGDAR